MNALASSELNEGYFRWRCRRGMKELDFILNRFIDAEMAHLSESDKAKFDELLATEDMLLWYWLSGKAEPQGPEQHFIPLVERICAAGYHQK
ncbi:succinate dehydrogenase assembly factor 2 [Marinicella meishanensis]|uniref:FAD assembly factor SdhE n=1 Tax=Marinicella meishanensis TaxID=2873263 RepID=UPI001CBB51DD|nr:succinate dehydrogenase assembly factor 2 [Marinicella sp. NBU2979]